MSFTSLAAHCQLHNEWPFFYQKGESGHLCSTCPWQYLSLDVLCFPYAGSVLGRVFPCISLHFPSIFPTFSSIFLTSRWTDADLISDIGIFGAQVDWAPDRPDRSLPPNVTLLQAEVTHPQPTTV